MMDEQRLGQSPQAHAAEAEAERLSAWIDNELPKEDGQRLAQQVITTAPMRAQWEQWHLIGDVMRSAPLARPSALGQRVSQALASEPIHFPAKSSRSARQFIRQRQWIYGGAAAAAIAFVALVTIAPQMQDGSLNSFLAMGSGAPSQSSQATVRVAEPTMPVPVQDPRLRELMDAHGSMSIRPVSVEVR